MEVILLNDVEALGLRGEVVTVADGYARNFLLPRRLAEKASAGRVQELRRLEEQRARHEARSAEQAQEIAAVLGKTVLRFEVQAGPTGTLFGSVTATNVADEIWRTRKIRVDRRKIDLRDSIKRIGRYEIGIDVFEDVRVEVKTLVVPEGGELPPEEELEAMRAAEEAEAAAAAGPPEPAAEAVEYLDEREPAEDAGEPGAEEGAAEEPAVEADAESEPEPGAETETA